MKNKVFFLFILIGVAQVQAFEWVSALTKHKKEAGLAVGAVVSGIAVYKVYQKICALNNEISRLARENSRIAAGSIEVAGLNIRIEGLLDNNASLNQSLSDAMRRNAAIDLENDLLQVTNHQLGLAIKKLIQQRLVLIFQKAILVKKNAELNRANPVVQIEGAMEMQRLFQENESLRQQLIALQEQDDSDDSQEHSPSHLAARAPVADYGAASSASAAVASGAAASGSLQEESKNEEKHDSVNSELDEDEDWQAIEGNFEYNLESVQKFEILIDKILKAENLGLKFNIILLEYSSWMATIEHLKDHISPKLNPGSPGQWDTQFEKVLALELRLKEFYGSSPWNHGKEVMWRLVNEGQQYIDSIKANKDKHLKAIIDLIWYFNSLALKKGQYFTEGAFGLVHHRELVNELLQAYENYPRNGERSSHLKEEDAVIQYGLDINKDSLPMPNNMTHLLFANLDRRNVLYIKAEPHGLGNWADTLGHTGGYICSVYKKITGANEGQKYRKEHLPDAVKRLWKNLIKAYTTERDLSFVQKAASCVGFVPEVVSISKAGIKYGISAMRKLLKSKIFKNANPTDVQIAAKQEFLEEIQKYDNLEYRRGNEVILTQADFGF
jgi:hypothetical protein